MLQGASIPLIAKMCAAFVVTTGAGVATYEIAIDTPQVEMVVDTEASGSSLKMDEPVALAFSGERDEQREDAEKETRLAEEQEAREAEEERATEEKQEAENRESEAKEAEKLQAEEAAKAEVDIDPPALSILHPEDGSHFETKTVVFEGEAEPGALVKAGRYEADVNENGSWRIELVLSPGANRAVISAYDAAGNVTEASVTVHLDVEDPKEEPKNEPKDDDPVSITFTANQKFGSCEEEIPYDVFWGTAPPNTVVHIVSDFGSAQVEVGKHGQWEKKVYFENAPRGDQFAVVVEAANGRQVFEFIARELVS